MSTISRQAQTVAAPRGMAGVRRATKPSLREIPLWLRATASPLRWVLIGLAIIVGVLGDPAVLVTGIASLWLAEKATDRLDLWGRPRRLHEWVIPAATIIGAPWSLWLLPPLAGAAAALWSWSPWLGRFAASSSAAVGWSPYKAAIRPEVTSIAGDTYGMTRFTEPEEFDYYQVSLRTQLEQLPDTWEVTYDRVDADALVVGPGGVIALFSVSCDGLTASYRLVDDPEAEAIAQRGAVALREFGSTLVAGSVAGQVINLPANAHLPREAVIEAAHIEQLRAVNELESEFVDAEGDDFGWHLPPAPVQQAEYLATVLRMPADSAPTPILIGHDVEMDAPWGRVHVFDDDRGWLGWAILCHPSRVRECIEAQPGAFESEEQVAAAQHAVDLRTR